MHNIASYQEGYTDGAHDQKCNIKNKLKEFIKNNQYYGCFPYYQGYNTALKDLEEYIEEI